MPKRRHNNDLEYYQKKLRKIERKIKRRQKCDNISDDEIQKSVSSNQDCDMENEDPNIPVSLATDDALCMNAIETTSALPQLEVLQALGDLMPEKPIFGPAINNDVARIWNNILKNGLPRDLKIKIMEQTIPENCSLLRAPKLNPEIHTSINENIVNRDKKIEIEQNQLGMGLTVISNVLSLLINNENVDKLKMISMLSDAGRILTDLHFMLTKSRKNLIFPVLDKKFLEVIKEVQRDEFLYGDNLSEKIKMLKNCQRSGQSIKKPNYNRPQGNLSGPPRHNPQRTSRYGPKKMQSSMQQKKYQPLKKQVRPVPPGKHFAQT